MKTCAFCRKPIEAGDSSATRDDGHAAHLGCLQETLPESLEAMIDRLFETEGAPVRAVHMPAAHGAIPSSFMLLVDAGEFRSAIRFASRERVDALIENLAEVRDAIWPTGGPLRH